MAESELGRGSHRRKAWLTLFSSSWVRPGGLGSPPMPVMSARWNQRSRALRPRGGPIIERRRKGSDK